MDDKTPKNKITDPMEMMLVAGAIGVLDILDTERIDSVWSYRSSKIEYRRFNGLKTMEKYTGPYVMIDYKPTPDESGIELYDKLHELPHFLNWESLGATVRIRFKYTQDMLGDAKIVKTKKSVTTFKKIK